MLSGYQQGPHWIHSVRPVHLVEHSTVCQCTRDRDVYSRGSNDATSNRRARRARPSPGTPRSPSDSVIQTVDVAETVALGAATVAGLRVAMDLSRPADQGRAVTDAVTNASRPSTSSRLLSGNGSTTKASTVLSSLVLVSLILRKVSSRLVEQRRQASPTSQAMRRLQNVEAAVDRGDKVLEGVLRDVDGLKVRSRLIGREMREMRKVVEEGALGREEMGRVMGVRMEEISEQVKDLEDLTSSVHGVMAKQVGLISGVVTKVRGMEQEMADVRTRVGIDQGEGSKKALEALEMLEGEGGERQQGKDEAVRKQERVVVQEVVTREKDGTVLYSFES